MKRKCLRIDKPRSTLGNGSVVKQLQPEVGPFSLSPRELATWDHSTLNNISNGSSYAVTGRSVQRRVGSGTVLDIHLLMWAARECLKASNISAPRVEIQPLQLVQKATVTCLTTENPEQCHCWRTEESLTCTLTQKYVAVLAVCCHLCTCPLVLIMGQIWQMCFLLSFQKSRVVSQLVTNFKPVECKVNRSSQGFNPQRHDTFLLCLDPSGDLTSLCTFF